MNIRQSTADRDGRNSGERFAISRASLSACREWQYASFSQVSHGVLDDINGMNAACPRASGNETLGGPACFVERLPNELLCAIFILCGSTVTDVSAFSRDMAVHDVVTNYQPYSKTAIMLGRVCSRWLIVTRGYPALWTLADIGYPGRKGLNILGCCLRYSAGLPIALQICDSIPVDNDGKGVDHRLMLLIAANAPRWKELYVDLLGDGDALKPLLGLPAGSFTSLDRALIRVRYWDTTASSPDTLLWLSIFTSPNLRHADMDNVHHVRACLLAAPFHQLKSLGLRHMSPNVLSPILAQSLESLEVLLIHGDAIDPWDLWDIESLDLVHLPRLKTLILSGTSSRWTPLFRRLDIPALVRLEIFQGSVYSEEIEVMIMDSSARVRMMAFHDLESSQADNINDLIRSPTLQSLRILWCDRCGDYSLEEEGVPFDFTPYVPSHITVFTTEEVKAEAAYRSLYT
ncbi:hypothetical protein EV714DRAFT_287549 [Schizophyllum commune]